jgi:ketosteroid isomerase-like protein
MALKDVELVRSILAGWERGDWSSAEWAHSEIELVHVDGPDPGRWKGLTRMAEGLRGWLGAWEELRVAADEYRELDDERVLVLVHVGGRGKTSGLELEQMGARGALLFQVRSGEVTRILVYFDRARAFADLGVTPTAGKP